VHECHKRDHLNQSKHFHLEGFKINMHKKEVPKPKLHALEVALYNSIELTFFMLVLIFQFQCKVVPFLKSCHIWAPVVSTDIYRDPMVYASCSMKFSRGSMTRFACDESACDSTWLCTFDIRPEYCSHTHSCIHTETHTYWHTNTTHTYTHTCTQTQTQTHTHTHNY